MRLVRVGPGACADTQLGLERGTQGTGLDETDQALGDDGRLTASEWSSLVRAASAVATSDRLART